MRFYNQQHRFYCGVDLHARTMSLCILDGCSCPSVAESGGSGGGFELSLPELGIGAVLHRRPQA